MVKKALTYTDQINFLTIPGTLSTLRAIAFFRGDVGKMGTAARDMMSMGIEAWKSGLSPSEAARFKEILKAVQLAESIRRE